jgi:hypothetical protein
MVKNEANLSLVQKYYVHDILVGASESFAPEFQIQTYIWPWLSFYLGNIRASPQKFTYDNMEMLDEVFKWQMGEKLAAGTPYVWSQQKCRW